MTKTRDLANLVSGSNPLVDGVIDYSEITNTPAPFDPDTLAAVAVSGSYADLGGKPALATVATSGSFTDLSNQPAPFDPATLAAVATTGAYGSLSGTPALATVATTGAYSSLSGVPALAAVATSGSYSSLSGTPAAALPLTGGTLSGTLSTPALNIGGTQVISNARNISNVGTVTATSFVGSGAGLTGLSYAPLPPTWDPSSTPNVTYTSSTTWTKPALDSGTWVIFYLIGGGGSGRQAFWSYGGSGGAAAVCVGILGQLPSSISIVVGAGGNGPSQTPGSNTTISASGVTLVAAGGVITVDTNATDIVFPVPANPFGPVPTIANCYGAKGGGRNDIGFNAIFGGAGGGAGYASSVAGGTSLYAGNGGTGRISSPAGNGGFPGGGGGGSAYSTRANGGNGACKVWYL